MIDPSSGVILNWNNKPARGYAGADDEWTWGPVQRVDLLWAGIQRRKKHTLASVVAAMNGAATQDLRLMRVWPVVREVLARGSGTPRATAAAAQLDTWYASGGSRLDANLDGKVDAAGAAVLDAAWSKIANAVLGTVLDKEARAALEQLVPNDAPLETNGSSAYSGWWSYVEKDLRACWGDPSRARSRRGSAAGATSRSARSRCGPRSTRRPPSSRRHRGRIRPRGVQTRRRSGSGSRRGSSPDDARLEQADVPAGDHVRHAPVGTGRLRPERGATPRPHLARPRPRSPR